MQSWLQDVVKGEYSCYLKNLQDLDMKLHVEFQYNFLIHWLQICQILTCVLILLVLHIPPKKHPTENGIIARKS